jgi:hypothetical protein
MVRTPEGKPPQGNGDNEEDTGIPGLDRTQLLSDIDSFINESMRELTSDDSPAQVEEHHASCGDPTPDISPEHPIDLGRHPDS